MTLCGTMDCGLPGSSVHGILQASILEWVAIPFSRGSSQPRDRTVVSCITGRFFTIRATWEALLPGNLLKIMSIHKKLAAISETKQGFTLSHLLSIYRTRSQKRSKKGRNKIIIIHRWFDLVKFPEFIKFSIDEINIQKSFLLQ